MTTTFEIFGWIGAGTLLFAYFLSTKNNEGKPAFRLPLINLIGSILLLCNATYFKMYPFVLVNAFWAIISTTELIKLASAKKV